MNMQSLIAGDTLSFDVTSELFGPADGWTAHLRAVHQTEVVGAIELLGNANAGKHRFTASAATSATWTPGTYAYGIWVERAGESHTLESGTWQIMPNPRAQVAGAQALASDITLDEARQHLQLWVAASARIAEGQSYKIGDRELRRADLAEVRNEIEFWRKQVNRLSYVDTARRPSRVRYGVPLR